jgi:hypothetical protein
LTITFGDILNFKYGSGVWQNLYFGIGYNYFFPKWNIGACLITSPYHLTYSSSPHPFSAYIGVKINGGYWFTDTLGATLMMAFASPVNYGHMKDIFLFNIGTGVSLRF